MVLSSDNRSGLSGTENSNMGKNDTRDAQSPKNPLKLCLAGIGLKNAGIRNRAATVKKCRAGLTGS